MTEEKEKCYCETERVCSCFILGKSEEQTRTQHKIEVALKELKENILEKMEYMKDRHDMPNKGDQYMLCAYDEAINLIKSL